MPSDPPVLHAYQVMHAYWHAHIHVTPFLKILAMGLKYILHPIASTSQINILVDNSNDKRDKINK